MKGRFILKKELILIEGGLKPRSKTKKVFDMVPRARVEPRTP